ncbi:universal stress protein [Alsobacter sp. R-9]
MQHVILAAVDGGPLSARVVQTAFQLRDATRGFVRAVHVRDPSSMDLPALARGDVPVDAGGVMQVQVGARSSAAARAWGTAPMVAGQASYTEADGDETDIYVATARVSDISIVGRPGSDPLREAPAYVKGLIFTSGRPVLVVPPASPDNWLEHALVVWNDSPQAARALSAAMPMLSLARTVTVVSVGSERERPSTEPVASYLARHGIRSSTHGLDPGLVTSRGRGRAIVNYAHSLGVGLTVMGAYGDQGFLSFLGLGGATGKVITGTRMPLLLAS